MSTFKRIAFGTVFIPFAALGLIVALGIYGVRFGYFTVTDFLDDLASR